MSSAMSSTLLRGSWADQYTMHTGATGGMSFLLSGVYHLQCRRPGYQSHEDLAFISEFREIAEVQ